MCQPVIIMGADRLSRASQDGEKASGFAHSSSNCHREQDPGQAATTPPKEKK